MQHGKLQRPWATRFRGMPTEQQALGPYVERSRADWAELAEHAQVSLDPATLERVRGLGIRPA